MRCVDKKLFFDRITAEMARLKAEKKYGKVYKTYRCPRCAYWHLATKKVKV